MVAVVKVFCHFPLSRFQGLHATTMPDDDLSLTALRVLAQLAYGQTKEPLRTRAQRDLQRRLLQLKEIRDDPDIPPKLRRHAESTLKELG
jgi:hypothetical protein